MSAWQTWPAASTGSNFIRKIRSARRDQGLRRRGRAHAGSCRRAHPRLQGRLGEGRRLPGRGFAARHARDFDGRGADTGAGGFILPNDHVDVLLTHRDKAAEKLSGIEKYVSETILRNVRVLAVDQALGEKDGQKVVIGKTATIELDPRQAETLALARQTGTLSLMLRSLLDSQSPTPEGGEAKEESRTTVSTVRYGVTTQSTPR